LGSLINQSKLIAAKLIISFIKTKLLEIIFTLKKNYFQIKFTESGKASEETLLSNSACNKLF
jgi:hypothetical protein